MTTPKQKPSKAEVERQVLAVLKLARQEPRFQPQRERAALIDAIQYGHTEVAHSLLVHGVDPNSTEPKGKSALWYAAHWTRSTLIRDLVERDARLPDDVLMGPVFHGDVESVRLLVQHGANVNCVASYTRYSPKFPRKEVLLTVAIQSVSRLELVAATARNLWAAATQKWRKFHPPVPPNEDWESVPIMLIEAGAEVNRLAFEYSLHEGYIRTVLGLAAHCRLVRTVKAMLVAGVDVNQKDTLGGTALFDAAHEGHLQVAKLLLAAGAKKDIKHRDGTTPGSVARSKGFTDLADAIESHAP